MYDEPGTPSRLLLLVLVTAAMALWVLDLLYRSAQAAMGLVP